MPLVGFGTWKLKGHTTRQAVLAALAAGYRHLDTATMYGNEDEVGQALRESGIDRSQVFLVTKIRPSDAGRTAAVLRASLRALGTDYLDLWLVHWPPARATDRRQLWHELVAAQEAGHVRDIGVSNYDLDQLDDLTSASGHSPAVNQVHWSPDRYDPVIEAGHQQRGVALEGYSPLRDTKLNDPTLTKIAAAHSVTTPQVVLRWHLDHGIVVIPKSAQPDRIRANFDVFRFSLTADEVASIDALGA
jgi:2,5-diketo-D-gluconate reductase A